MWGPQNPKQTIGQVRVLLVPARHQSIHPGEPPNNIRSLAVRQGRNDVGKPSLPFRVFKLHLRSPVLLPEPQRQPAPPTQAVRPPPGAFLLTLPDGIPEEVLSRV